MGPFYNNFHLPADNNIQLPLAPGGPVAPAVAGYHVIPGRRATSCSLIGKIIAIAAIAFLAFEGSKMGLQSITKTPQIVLQTPQTVLERPQMFLKGGPHSTRWISPDRHIPFPTGMDISHWPREFQGQKELYDPCETVMSRLDYYENDDDFSRTIDAIVNEPSCDLWDLRLYAHKIEDIKRKMSTIKKVEKFTEQRIKQFFEDEYDTIQAAPEIDLHNLPIYKWLGRDYGSQDAFSLIASHIKVRPHDVINSPYLNQIDEKIIKSASNIYAKGNLGDTLRVADQIMNVETRDYYVSKFRKPKIIYYMLDTLENIIKFVGLR